MKQLLLWALLLCPLLITAQEIDLSLGSESGIEYTWGKALKKDNASAYAVVTDINGKFYLKRYNLTSLASESTSELQLNLSPNKPNNTNHLFFGWEADMYCIHSYRDLIVANRISDDAKFDEPLVLGEIKEGETYTLDYRFSEDKNYLLIAIKYFSDKNFIRLEFNVFDKSFKIVNTHKEITETPSWNFFTDNSGNIQLLSFKRLEADKSTITRRLVTYSDFTTTTCFKGIKNPKVHKLEQIERTEPRWVKKDSFEIKPFVFSGNEKGDLLITFVDGFTIDRSNKKGDESLFLRVDIGKVSQNDGQFKRVVLNPNVYELNSILPMLSFDYYGNVYHSFLLRESMKMPNGNTLLSGDIISLSHSSSHVASYNAYVFIMLNANCDSILWTRAVPISNVYQTSSLFSDGDSYKGSRYNMFLVGDKICFSFLNNPKNLEKIITSSERPKYVNSAAKSTLSYTLLSQDGTMSPVKQFGTIGSKPISALLNSSSPMDPIRSNNSIYIFGNFLLKYKTEGKISRIGVK